MNYKISAFLMMSLLFVFPNAFAEMKVYEQTIETEKVIAVYDEQEKTGHLTVFPCETCEPRSFVFNNSLRVFVNGQRQRGAAIKIIRRHSDTFATLFYLDSNGEAVRLDFSRQPQ